MGFYQTHQDSLRLDEIIGDSSEIYSDSFYIQKRCSQTSRDSLGLQSIFFSLFEFMAGF